MSTVKSVMSIERFESIESKISDLEIAQANRRTEIDRLKSEVATQKTLIGALQEAVKPISPAFCEEMESRHNELTARFHLAITKITVLTEVAFALRRDEGMKPLQREQILQAVIYCIDLPDAWWQSDGAKHRSVLDWADACLHEARRHRLVVASTEL